MTEILTDAFINGSYGNENIPRRYGQIIDRVYTLKKLADFGAHVDISKEPYAVQIGVQAWQKAKEKWMERDRNQHP